MDIIIIPCYNEENRFKPAQWLEFIESNQFLNFCFVNDGSEDNTLLILKTHFDDVRNVKILSFEENLGKAEAIRQSILLMGDNYDNSVFIDADLEIPLQQITKLLEFKKNNKEALVCISNRINTYSITSFKRYLGSKFINKLANLILAFPFAINDTQCGCKLISRDVISIFNEPFISSWLFDIELLLRLKYQFSIKQKQIGIVDLLSLNETNDKGNFPTRVMFKLLGELYTINKTYN
ncbi:dolichyl phosphate glucosyltransferase [Nonlabens ulvanivorans]|nr:glycosyltransferase [Nonlabens ulvanivorans]GAK93143.1 dolichyl phosphate glucosyltransferase [Nonlabens ulvanivorans]